MRTVLPVLVFALLPALGLAQQPGPFPPVTPLPVAVLRGHRSEVVPVAFSPDGSLLATGSWDGDVKLWEPTRHIKVATLRGHDGKASQLLFSSDGKRLAVAGGEEIRLWDVETRTWTRLPRNKWPVYHLCFSPGNQLLAYSSGRDVLVWDVAKEKGTAGPLEHERRVTCLAFSPGGKKLAVGDDSNHVTFWNPRTGKRSATFEGHDDRIYGLRFSDDGRYLNTVGENAVLWWDTTTQRRVASRPFASRSCGEVAFARDGSLLAAPDYVGNVQLCDLDRGRTEAVIDSDIVNVWDVTFSPNGKLLAWATRQNEIWLWDVEPRRLRARLRGHTKRITGLTFSPDGRVLVSGSWDRSVRVWRTGD